MCDLSEAVDIHHRAGRGMGGNRQPWINQPSNLLHLCRRCHHHVTDTGGRRAGYERNGWIVTRSGLQRPADVPVLVSGSWVLLRDDGTVGACEPPQSAA